MTVRRAGDWRAPRERERESDDEQRQRLESSERESDNERFRVFFFTGWVWILSIPDPNNSGNIHTLSGSSWVEFNRVLPETFGSGRVNIIHYPMGIAIPK